MRVTQISSGVGNFSVNNQKTTKKNKQNDLKKEPNVTRNSENLSFGQLGIFRRWTTYGTIALGSLLNSCQNAAEKGVFYVNKNVKDPVNRVVHYYQNVGYVGETLFDSIVTNNYKLIAQQPTGKVKAYKTDDGGLLVMGTTKVLEKNKLNNSVRENYIGSVYQPEFESEPHMNTFIKHATESSNSDLELGEYLMLPGTGSAGSVYKSGKVIAQFNRKQLTVPLPRRNVAVYIKPKNSGSN